MILKLFFIILLPMTIPKVHASSCMDLLSEYNEKNTDETKAFVSYLSSLIENGTLKKSDLEKIANAKSVLGLNPILHRDIIDVESKIHSDGIDEFLLNAKIESTYVNNWVMKKIKEISRKEESQNVTEKITRNVFTQMEFNDLEPKTFVISSNPIIAKNKEFLNIPKEVSLNHKIQMMSTVVTQAQWVELMGQNPTKDIYPVEDLTQLSIKGNAVKLNENHPVVSASYWSVLVFLNQLSKVNGFAPVYDLSNINFKSGTYAENGTLMPVDLKNAKVIINAPSGDIYQAKGYRLPTVAEQESVLQVARDKFSDESLKGTQQYFKYIHHRMGGGEWMYRVSPVKYLLPLMIENQPFYGLLGNVQELSSDCFLGDIVGGINPVGNHDCERISIRGGDNDLSVDFLLLAKNETIIYGQSRDWKIGFRVVRTVK